MVGWKTKEKLSTNGYVDITKWQIQHKLMKELGKMSIKQLKFSELVI